METNFFSTIEAALIITAIIQVIVLIAFFAMAKNVAKIKRSMVIKDADYYIEVAITALFRANRGVLRCFACDKVYSYWVYRNNQKGHIERG